MICIFCFNLEQELTCCVQQRDPVHRTTGFLNLNAFFYFHIHTIKRDPSTHSVIQATDSARHCSFVVLCVSQR
uniref:Uncharacterized protein n=1 Tax=Anguilla anguilla TaxID=7936 RepID=A0A0E9WRA1_ANGAN